MRVSSAVAVLAVLCVGSLVQAQSRQQREAGPIWNQEDAESKCPRVCAPPARWTGQWSTTIPGQMSVCECEAAAAPPSQGAPPPTPTPAPRAAGQRSLRGDRAVTVQFRNNLGRPVEAFWVDYNGVEQDYGTVPPGAHDRESFETHVWRFKVDGRAVSTAILSDQPYQTHEIGQPLDADPVQPARYLAPVDQEQQCYEAVQGRVAWDRSGNTRWVDGNVRNLCRGTTNPAATIACFQGQILAHGDWARAIPACNTATPTAGAGSDGQGYYNIAHMTNTVAAVDWALQQGANALEIDINFTDGGSPQVFYHGTPCDCSCLAGVAGVCPYLGPIPCEARTDAATLLRHIASRSGVALVFIDSKVGSLRGGALQTAGSQIITLLNNELLARGYRGALVVGAPDRDQQAYVAAAASAAQASVNASRYYFSIDQEGDETSATIQALVSLPTKRRVYGTGVSACSPTQYFRAIEQGAANERAGVVGLTYTWTIDRESSMNRYLQAGARGIITNEPGKLASVLRARGAALAAPGSTIPVATRDDTVPIGAAVGERCESNADCGNGACGRPHANDAAKVCCASNAIRTYAGYDYCGSMGPGTACWSDAMCASGNCAGNMSGLQRGKCK